MSSLKYGPIILTSLRVEQTREPVLDGPTYLYTRHQLHVTGWYNPKNRTAYQLKPGAGARPIAALVQDDVRPPESDRAVRFQLEQPRQQLIYWVGTDTDLGAAPDFVVGPGGQEVLRSPRFDPVHRQHFTVDASNGPRCRVHAVRRVHGLKTWEVEATFETDVNESYLYRDQTGKARVPPAILSHRWRMEEAIDEHYASVRTIHGKAVFNSERLEAYQVVPDDFRAFLFHPVPKHFKRTAVNVIAHEDNTALEYVLVDKLLFLDIVPKGVTRIEAWQEASGNNLGVENIASATGSFLWDAAGRIAQAVAAANGIPAAAGGGSGTQQNLDLSYSLANRGFGLLTSLVPMTNISIGVRVWGSRGTSRKVLERAALSICTMRLAMSFPPGVFGAVPRFTGAQQVTIKHDLAGAYVEAQLGLLTALALRNFNLLGLLSTTGIAATALTAFSTPDLGIHFPENPNVFFPNHDPPFSPNDTPSFLEQENWSEDNHSLPKASKSHGSYLGQVAAEALLAATDPVQHPPDPGQGGEFVP